MKIFIWGNNYPPGNKALSRSFLSQEPHFYLKPDSSLLKDGKPFFLPDFSGDIRAGIELVLKIGRLGKSISPRFASRYYSQVTVGVNITAADLLEECISRKTPWDVAVGFDNSAVVGHFIPLPQKSLTKGLAFGLKVNGISVQSGDTSQMRLSVEEGISGLSRYYTLKIGDLIYTGGPKAPVPLSIGDHLEGFLEEEKLLDFYIR